MIANDASMELIETLHEGGMLSHPVIQRHVDRALHTGDYGNLEDYVKRFPIFLAQARRNIALAHVQGLDNPYRPYPTYDEVREYLSGPLKSGYVNARSDMFGMHWDIFCLPTIVPGRVGAGKSMFLKFLLSQILKEKYAFNVILPDLKAEYRDLLTITSHIRVLTSNRIKINPLEVPPWMSPDDHILFFAKIFSRENWVGIVSEKIISDAIEYLYWKRGIFDGNTKNYPTMKDLYHFITYRLETQRSFQFRDVLLKLQGRIKDYLICKAYDCRKGIPHDIWRNENLVLEMDSGFNDHIYCFTVSYIAGLRYTYNKKMGLIGSVLRTLFNVDEGRILFAKRDIEIYGESYITEIITKTREFGVGFIVASPETESFNQTIKAISFLKVCFPLTDGNEKAAIEKSFGLNDEQADYLFKLPRFGQAIVRYGGYEKPFLLAVPYFNLKKHLTDEDVEGRMSSFYAELERKIKSAETPRQLEITENIPPAAVALLYFLGKEPFTKVSDMTNAGGFRSPAEVNKALNWLETNGFIRRKRETYRVSKRGRKSSFVPLTAKAYRYLDMKGPEGKGDFEHKLYQHIIKEKEKSEAIDVKIEGRMKGSKKASDVLARYKGRGYVSFEVTLHFENLISNILQDFSSGVNEVVIVTRNQPESKRAVKKVGKEQSLNQYLERISFLTMDDFF